jgi:hypothetical protein
MPVRIPGHRHRAQPRDTLDDLAGAGADGLHYAANITQSIGAH